jgi:hypothetical protein
MDKPRLLFTEGWNSFWHFIFGMVATKYFLVVILFVAYQCQDIYEKNIHIDLGEFALGYIFAKTL